MSKKVRAVIRIDDIEQLFAFDGRVHGVLWFQIPKGQNIRFIDKDVYFDHIALDVAIESKQVILIGYTPEITAVGLVGEEAVKRFPSKPIVVKEFKLHL